MKWIKLGLLFGGMSICVFFSGVLFWDHFYWNHRYEIVEKEDFDFFPFPVANNDNCLELIHVKNTPIDSDGIIVLSDEQAVNFSTLDPLKATIADIDLDGWPFRSLTVEASEDGRKSITIYLVSHKRRIKSHTVYEFKAEKLKLISASWSRLNLGWMIILGYLTFGLLAVGIAFTIVGIISLILFPKPKYSFLEPPPNIDSK